MGLYVHVSDEPFCLSNENLFKFIMLYVTYEHIIYKFGYNGPNPRLALSKYAYPLREDLIKLLEIMNIDFDYFRNIKIISDKLEKKIYGLNFYNIVKTTSKTDTIEFRMCNGTIDPIVIQNEIDLFCNIMLSLYKDIDVDFLINKIENNYFTDLNEYGNINLKDLFKFVDLVFESDESKNRFILQYIKE